MEGDPAPNAPAIAHQDRGGLAAPVSAKIFEGVAARAHGPGDGLHYDSGEEYRSVEELARMAPQFVGVPFLLMHPPGGALLRDGAQGHEIGKVIAARVDGDKLVVQVLVTDPAGEAAIQDGVHELSAGYLCRLDGKRYQYSIVVDHLAAVPQARCGGACSLRTDASAGTAATSGNATCNCRARDHSSLVVEVEANQDGTLNAAARHALSAKQFAVPGRETLPLEDEGHVKDAMARFDQTSFQGPAERKSAFHRIVARAHELGIDPSGFVKKYGGRLDQKDTMSETEKQEFEAAKAEAATQKSRADAAEKARDAEKARADAAELATREAQKDANAEKTRADAADVARKAAEDKAVIHTDEAFQARVDQRVEVLAAATKVLPTKDDKGVAIDRSKASDIDLMKEISRHVDGDDAVLDSDGDAAVRVCFRGAMKRHDAANASHAGARVAVNQMRQNAETASTAKANDTEEAAYAAMTSNMQRSRAAKKN